ncbi:alkaline phosphatase family protein [Cupriavidus sp. CV2]|uniref:alkaline phosphatase family protein n=1 Tax=Cupriavidus ulmosensis TaxID=3065913 RepID=UPI00296B4EC0|nr:alkaline phosphatase family protein [Cupriavidus sp. CV2]MDW3682172.1 alkaline phosphatase family protein [Cupriavidus sp. CV2]
MMSNNRNDDCDHKDPSVPDSQRRKLLGGLAAAAGISLLPSCGGGGDSSSLVATAALPDPGQSGIDHIVVVMMENRSFDHYLGWLPGADGKQAGLSFADRNGKISSTYPLAPEFQGCAYQDPDQSHEGGITEYNNGKCDGFLLTSSDTFPIGYYRQEDLSFHGQAAPAWTVYDRYFCSIMAETEPNRFYMHSAQTPAIHNKDVRPAIAAQMPTIWDKLSAAGVSGKYYYSDVPYLASYGSKYAHISQPLDQFLAAAAAGTLPNVSYVDPAFVGNGTQNDDHPFGDIRDGQAFMNQIYGAVTQSPQWPKTALFFIYDEWGGFFDHVPPPFAGVIPPFDLAAFKAINETPSSQLGFRIPAMAVSPFARRGYVAHDQYDHTSILKMIEWRFGLTPLTVRDAQAANIAESFDFQSGANVSAPAFTVPSGPFGKTCAPKSLAAGSAAAAIRAEHNENVQKLAQLAQQHGFWVAT